LALCVDDVESHKKWINDINETQHTHVDFSIIADEDKKIAQLFDMIYPNASETHTVRSSFIIGPDKKLKLYITYPASTGRNFNEVLRVLDSLQLSAKYPVATPANWNPGDDVIFGLGVSTEEAPARFPKGVKVVKPYLRYTPQPDKE
jgi:alkyl hydroperoxide reductase subunit AhpC